MEKNKTNYDYKSNFKLIKKYKYIFIHIPKTAGISISKTIYDDNVIGHRSLKKYKNINLKDYYIFSFVRNPYDRIFSAYNFLKKGGINDLDRDFNDKYLNNLSNFEEFVLDFLNSKSIYSYIHFIPQYEFLINSDNNFNNVDFIGKFENIEKDFYFIKNKLNINKKLKKENIFNLKHLNYNDYYTIEMKEKIFNLYKKDFLYFNYEK